MSIGLEFDSHLPPQSSGKKKEEEEEKSEFWLRKRDIIKDVE